jgi:hypothetical protein
MQQETQICLGPNLIYISCKARKIMGVPGEGSPSKIVFFYSLTLSYWLIFVQKSVQKTALMQIADELTVREKGFFQTYSKKQSRMSIC